MPILFFLPGILITPFFKKFNQLEKLSISFFFSILIILLIGALFFTFGIVWSQLLFFPYLLAVSIFLFLNRKMIKNIRVNKEVKVLLIIFFLAFFYKIILQIFIKYYPMASDWVGHYKTSLFLLEKEPTLQKSVDEHLYLPYRAPGFYMIISFFLAIFGKDFWVAQLANTLINTIFIFPTYLLGKGLFNKRIALLTVIFLQVIPFIEVSMIIIAKMVTAYFCLLFFYLLLVKRTSGYMLGLVAGIAFLIHQYSLVYVGVALLISLLSNPKRNVRMFIQVIVIFAIVISPWLLLNYRTFGTVSTSDYINFPLYVNYDKQLEEKYTTAQLWEGFKKTPITYTIGVRAINLVNAITPSVLIFKIASQFTPIIIHTHEITNFNNVPWAYHYYHSIPGNLTFLLYFFSIIGFIKLWKKNRVLFYFILLPIIFFDLWFGWVILTLVRSGLPVIVPLLIMVGFWEVSKRKNADKWIKLIFILGLVELFIFSVFYSWHIQIAERLAIENENLPYKEFRGISAYESLFSAYKLFHSNKI